jgi:glycerol-3-phosphate acyltransferase PlsX
MINIGIDIMGGDLAPIATLKGSVSFLAELKGDTRLHLVGPAQIIEGWLAENKIILPDNCVVVDAPQTIEMGEHPVKALQAKPQSSLNVGFGMLAAGKLNGFASAGNSGAVMVAAMHALKLIEGVNRPCAIGVFPQLNGNTNILVDVGINVDAKPEMLVQFAQLGATYAKVVHQIENPRIGLLNTGAEPGKGSLLYQRAHELLSNSKDLTFTGNIEARDFYDGTVDVTVCDGFTGNVFLKQAEGFYQLVAHQQIKDSFLEKFNYELYGGTPILGVRGNVVLGHGVSSPKAITNMIHATEKIARAKLSEHLTKAFK